MKNLLINFFKYLVKDIKTILAALFLSIIVWFAISMQIFPNVQTHIDGVKVNSAITSYMSEENLKIDPSFNESVSIQIEGKRYELGSIDSSMFYATLDLSGVFEAGEHIVPINVEYIGEYGITVLNENMQTTVNVMKIITKTIDVIPTTDDIIIMDGMQIDDEDLTANPPTITITGEEQLVNTIDHIYANAISEDIIESTSELKSELEFYNKSNTKIQRPDLTYDNTAFTVTVALQKVKTLPLTVSLALPTNFDASSLNYSISPSEITISSPDNSIDNLEALAIGEISLFELTPSNLETMTIPITLPDGYKNISGNKTATITFEVGVGYGSLGFTVPKDNITILNAPSNYDIDINTNQLFVNVVGPSDKLMSMTSDDIYITANLLGVDLSEGYKTITVTARVQGSNVQTWVTGEYSISIYANPSP